MRGRGALLVRSHAISARARRGRRNARRSRQATRTNVGANIVRGPHTFC